MALGARPIGTRSLGDSAPADPVVAFTPPGPGVEVFASISISGSASVEFDAVAITSGKASFTATGDISLTATNTVDWSRIEFTGNGYLDVAPQFSGTKRRVVIADYEGNPITELDRANISPVVYELNKPETWSFTLTKDDPKVAAVIEEYVREVQLWRGEQLLSWGPMSRPQISDQDVQVTVNGAMWHLGRRHIGKAERTNYVKNGDFERGLANWDMATNPVPNFYGWPGAQPTPPNHAIVNFPTITGKRALELENYVAGADAWASQEFGWEVQPNTSPDGDQWTLVGYVYVKNFSNQASEGRGLYLERFSTTELNPDPLVQAVQPGAPLSLEVAFVPINEETPQGVWERMEVGFTAPVTGEPEVINVRLYAPDGEVVWDRISLTLDERTGFYGKDQAKIAEEIVEHLQDPAYDKSDVNITTDCQPTKVLRDRVYYHSEHPNGLRSIEEFTTLSDGFDIDILYTPTDRIFRTHFPQKGRHLPKFALETGRNISTFAWTFDGEAAATSVIVLGTGDGSGREEGAAVDTSTFAGLTLEEVFVAPPDTRIEALDNIAFERLATTTSPEILAVRTTTPRGSQADPVGVLDVGDTVPVRIEQGAFLLTGTYRVTRLSVNPDDTLDLVLNKRELEI